MVKILDGKKVADSLLFNLKKEIEKMHKKPVLRIIRTGDFQASKIYVNMKLKKASEIGIDAKEIYLKNPNKEELIEKIENLNKDDFVNGYIIQLPLANNINEKQIIEKIDPNKDVDCFHPINMGNFFCKYPNYDHLLPCTPAGIIEILNFYNINLEGMNTVVIGRSNLVGKPLAVMLTGKNATVTLCHSRSKNLKEICKNADLLISAIGKPKFIKNDFVKENSIIIDVGINKDKNNKICGDVDFTDVLNKVKYITPVPGGVGPMTVAYLLKNVVSSCKKR